MNSEQVKAIKERLKKHYCFLERAYSDHLAYGGKSDEQEAVKIYLLRDILTLINDLENRINDLKNCLEVERIIAKERSEKLKKAEHDRDRYKRRIIALQQESAQNAESETSPFMTTAKRICPKCRLIIRRWIS